MPTDDPLRDKDGNLLVGPQLTGREKGAFKKGNTFSQLRTGHTYEPIKLSLKKIIGNYTTAEIFEEDLMSLEPVDRLNIVAKFLPFIVARKREITIDSFSPEVADEILGEILDRTATMKRQMGLSIPDEVTINTKATESDDNDE